MKTKVINFYGGPGSGKSTKAAGLYYKMNMAGFSVELNNEFAKECVWEDNVPMLKDQLYMLAHQHRKILRLVGKVDYVITDSPVLLSGIYRELYDGALYSDLIDQLALECYNKYDNINFQQQYECVGVLCAGLNDSVGVSSCYKRTQRNRFANFLHITRRLLKPSQRLRFRRMYFFAILPR